MIKRLTKWFFNKQALPISIVIIRQHCELGITLTSMCNLHPLEHYFYKVKVGFEGVKIFLHFIHLWCAGVKFCAECELWQLLKYTKSTFNENDVICPSFIPFHMVKISGNKRLHFCIGMLTWWVWKHNDLTLKSKLNLVYVHLFFSWKKKYKQVLTLSVLFICTSYLSVVL